MKKRSLTLDMAFDLHNIPLETSVIIYPYTEDFTWDNVAKIALALDKLMQENRIDIDKYTVLLEHKPQGKEKDYERIGARDFPREMLSNKNLPQAMEAFSQAMERESEK